MAIPIGKKGGICWVFVFKNKKKVHNLLSGVRGGSSVFWLGKSMYYNLCSLPKTIHVFTSNLEYSTMKHVLKEPYGMFVYFLVKSVLKLRQPKPDSLLG